MTAVSDEQRILVRGEAERQAPADIAALVVIVQVDDAEQARRLHAGERARRARSMQRSMPAPMPSGRGRQAVVVVQPTTAWVDGEERRTGWRATRSTSLDVTDLAQVTPLLSELVAAGAIVRGPSWRSPSRPPGARRGADRRGRRRTGTGRALRGGPRGAGRARRLDRGAGAATARRRGGIGFIGGRTMAASAEMAGGAEVAVEPAAAHGHRVRRGRVRDRAMSTMSPAEALDRVVYLLDRDLAEGRRVAAYAKARDLVRELGDDEVIRLHRAGELLDLPDIGKSTGHVIALAIDGGIDEHLAALEAETAIDVGEGAELRAALKGDCHSHTTWSDGGASVTEMARTAMALGHEYLVITDHSPRLTIAHGLNRERLLQQLDEIDAGERGAGPVPHPHRHGGRHPRGRRPRPGRSTCWSGSTSSSRRVHSKLRMAEQEMTRRMVLAVASPHVDILGHCTGRKVVGTGRPQSQFDADIVFAACARFDTAVEINCRPERQDPPEELLALALDWDCKVSIDTDAHAPGQLEWQALRLRQGRPHGDRTRPHRQHHARRRPPRLDRRASDELSPPSPPPPHDRFCVR